MFTCNTVQYISECTFTWYQALILTMAVAVVHPLHWP